MIAIFTAEDFVDILSSFVLPDCNIMDFLVQKFILFFFFFFLFFNLGWGGGGRGGGGNG